MHKVPKTSFPILAKTGRIDFPLHCTTKKTILDIQPRETDVLGTVSDDPTRDLYIDLGNVVFGEWSTKQLTIKNAGALPAKWTLEVLDENRYSCIRHWSRMTLCPAQNNAPFNVGSLFSCKAFAIVLRH